MASRPRPRLYADPVERRTRPLPAALEMLAWVLAAVVMLAVVGSLR